MGQVAIFLDEMGLDEMGLDELTNNAYLCFCRYQKCSKKLINVRVMLLKSQTYWHATEMTKKKTFSTTTKCRSFSGYSAQWFPTASFVFVCSQRKRPTSLSLSYLPPLLLSFFALYLVSSLCKE